MSTASAAPTTVASSVEGDDDALEKHVLVYNCTRIGLKANPPGFSILDLLRFGRRRRGRAAS